jgi:DNA polymerase III sliding clamp (beta) subunit (PCNA family)
MDRKLLIDALANVDPARSITNANEVMKTFWFTGKRVMAYNGGMAIAVPFKTDYTGAVQATLLPLLQSSGAPECEFEETDKGITVKAGASKFKLLTMAADKFNFSMPKFPETSLPIVDVGRFVVALKACKRSLGSETSEAAFKGITMIAGKGKIDMFAYDRLTLTQATVKVKGDIDWERVVVPTAIVDQLIRISEGATEMQIALNDKRIIVRVGDVTIWGTLEETERNPRPFHDQVKAIREHATSTIDATDKDFAKKFPAMLERAIIITADAVESTKLRVTIKDNRIFFYSKSSRGVVEDAILAQKHHDVQVRVPPSRVLAGLELGSLSFTEEAVVLSNPDQSITYFVSGD